MDILIGVAILILVIIWATRVEIGINKTNEALLRIEKQLQEKKEKK